MIKIAVCDDEISAVRVLFEKIKAYMSDKEMQYTAYKFLSGESLIASMAKQDTVFDAVFLDIKMNDISGIDTAKVIRQMGKKTIIVFVTALKEYVFDAFDVSAMNFLVKPIEEEKLTAVLDKIVEELSSAKSKSIVICKNDAAVRIYLENILYCEVLNHRVFIYEEKSTCEYGGKIDALEEELDESFFRCHRSYIINLKYVESYSNGIASVIGGEKVPIATRRQAGFMKALLLCQRRGVR